MLFALVLTVVGASSDFTVIEKVELLAANPKTKRAAVRLTLNLDPNYGSGMEEDVSPPVSCGYAGMKKGGTSGVTLLLWDLEKGKQVAEYVVYAVATKKAECTPRAESTRQLDEAKKAFAAVGLELAKPPAKADVSELSCQLEKENEDDDCGWTSTETCSLRGVVLSVDQERANCGPFQHLTRTRDWYVVDDAYLHVDLDHTNSMRGSWDAWSISKPVVVPRAKAK